MIKYAMEIIKDIITSLLILAGIIIIFLIIIYDKIALTQVVPVSEDYALSSQMKKELNDTDLDDTKEVIVNYYINAKDLNKYEATNEYIKGRQNPFAAVTTSTPNSNNSNNTSSDGNSSDNSSQNFYEDDGTK